MSDNDWIVYLIIILLLCCVVFLGTSTNKKQIETQETYNMVNKTSLPYSIIGEDYLLYYQSGDPSVWNSTEMLKFQNWRCNTARLGFSLDIAHWYAGMNSLYVQSKMDSVLNIFDAYGIKAILLLQNNGDHLNYCGTQSWVDNWVSIATHYAGDNRIAAFSIFGEPNPSTWADAGDYTSIGIINTKEKFIQVCKYCIDQIRAVDPTRKIVFPTVYGMGIGLDSTSTTYNLMNTYGVWAQGNIIMDILHPYFWENYPAMDPSTTPEGTAAWYGTNIIDPWVALIGADNCWIGETFAWYPDLTHELQVRWIKAIVNECLARGVGLDIWSYFGKQGWNNEGLTESNYMSYPLEGEEPPEPEPPIPPPPIQYYTVNVSSAGHGQTTPSGTIPKQVGQTFTAVASPNIDYLFDYWTRNGINKGTNPTYSMNDGVANLTYNLIAYFIANPPVEPDPPTPPAPTYFSVNIGISVGGTTSLVGEQTREAGQTLTVTITSIKDNYRFNYWLLDNSNWGSNQTFTLAGTANTSYTLLPVFQYVPPPSPNEPVIPGSDNLGIISKGNLETYFGATKKINKAIDFNEILKQLGKK